MASPGNQHCAKCIDTLSFSIVSGPRTVFSADHTNPNLSHALLESPPSSFSSQSIIYICRLFSTVYGGWRRETIKQAACIGRRRWKFLTGWIRSVRTALALCARCWNDAVHTDPTARPFTLYTARSCAVLVKPQEALLPTQRSAAYVWTAQMRLGLRPDVGPINKRASSIR